MQNQKIVKIDFQCGGHLTKYLDDNGKNHRNVAEGPATILVDSNGRIRNEVYFTHGKYADRGNLPSIIFYGANGAVELAAYYKDDRLHRADGPAYIEYHPNGVVRNEYFYNDGMATDMFGPQHKVYNALGQLTHEFDKVGLHIGVTAPAYLQPDRWAKQTYVWETFKEVPNDAAIELETDLKNMSDASLSSFLSHDMVEVVHGLAERKGVPGLTLIREWLSERIITEVAIFMKDRE